MTNRKLIKYAVAFERINEKGRANNWGVGAPVSYKAELNDNYHNYARERAGIKNSMGDGCTRGCFLGTIGAISLGTLGAVFAANDTEGLLMKTLYKIGAGIGGVSVGGVMGFMINLPRLYYMDQVIGNVAQERDKRKKQRRKTG